MLASYGESRSDYSGEKKRVMAAIMVAVNAYLEEEQRDRRPMVREAASFVVRSPWKSFGLLELMRTRTHFNLRPFKKRNNADRSDSLRKPLEKVV